ncbi:hypothetical protein GC197_00505 [bacterium]|nr:hypothetical protein [bacterium]
MLARRCIFVLPLFLCLFSSLALAQDVREWTDANGKKLEGKFLELTAEGNVRINSNGQFFSIPITAFSQADQDYARQQQKAKENMAPKEPVIDKSDMTLFDNREWSDFRGDSVKAKYVRMHEGYVILLQGNKAHKLSFYTLSTEDQKYLRGHLTKRGEADEILTREKMEEADPDVHKELDMFQRMRSPTTVGGTRPGPGPGGMTNNSSRGPAYVPPPFDPNNSTEPFDPSTEPTSNNSAGTANPGQPGSMPEATIPSEANNSGFGSNTEGTSMPSNNYSQPGAQPQNGGNNSSPGFGGRFDSVEPGYCPNCRQQLPKGIGPGDHCPRCNVFLESWVTPGNGPPVEPWYERYHVIYIVGAAIVIIGGLGLLSKKFYS